MTDLSVRSARTNTVETRKTAFRDVDLRAIPDGSGGENFRFTGYASVTESPYDMQDYLGDYTEVIRRGAFTRSLADGADVPFKINHGGLTLARTKSGTMRLAEDSTGLHVEADLDPASSIVRDLQSAMDRKDVDEMSFGFRVTSQVWSPDWTQRDITEVDLNKGDVSVVNYGANPATAGATLRGLDLAHLVRKGFLTPDQIRELEGLPPVPESTPVDLSPLATRIRHLNSRQYRLSVLPKE